VDIRIGVVETPKELNVEMPEETDADDVHKLFEDAIAGGAAMVWLIDRRGRQVGIPSAKIAYVEIGSPEDSRRIGFGG
jgi:hypothetical protein